LLPESFSENNLITFKQQNNAWTCSLRSKHKVALKKSGADLIFSPQRSENRTVNFDSIRSVWARRYVDPFTPPAKLSPRQSAWARYEYAESGAVLRSLRSMSPNSFWVNPASNANNKLGMLRLAQESGLAVPRTLLTNDPKQAKDFFRECRKEVIFKLLDVHDPQEGLSGIIAKMTAADIRDSDGIRAAPHYFQEHIPKKSDIRVNIIGRKIFATEILSQEFANTRLDFRADPNYSARLKHLPHKLPLSIQKMLMKFMKKAGLVFGAVDLILRPDGHYVFLEVNPHGQWIWIESLTGQPLLESFSEMLIQGTADYEDRPPERRVDMQSFDSYLKREKSRLVA